MYQPKHFQVIEKPILHDVIDKYPFATVTSVTDGKPFVNHLPITREVSPSGELILLGHMSRRNPQWQHMQEGSELLIAFHGPHAYINPNWYEENDAATWNYIVVHASGKAKLIEDYAGLVKILQTTTNQMNRLYKDQWKMYMPADLKSEGDLTSAIIGFEMRVTDCVGKFKLNQNRSEADIKGVVQGLKSRGDEGSLQIQKWMQAFLDQN